jgi:hypothetical protein
MRLEHPPGCQMRSADQPGLVRIMADSNDIDVETFGFEDYQGAADRQLADPSGAEPTTDNDALGITSGLQFKKALNHNGELLGELLNGSLDNARRLEITVAKQRI